MPRPSPSPTSPEKIINLGPMPAGLLAKAGILHVEQVRILGAIEIYLHVKTLSPKAGLNLLWALVGALNNIHWARIPGLRRSELLL